MMSDGLEETKMKKNQSNNGRRSNLMFNFTADKTHLPVKDQKTGLGTVGMLNSVRLSHSGQG